MKQRFLLILAAALTVLLGGLTVRAEESVQAYPVPEGGTISPLFTSS